jgi:hypothetical protein
MERKCLEYEERSRVLEAIWIRKDEEQLEPGLWTDVESNMVLMH